MCFHCAEYFSEKTMMLGGNDSKYCLDCYTKIHLAKPICLRCGYYSEGPCLSASGDLCSPKPVNYGVDVILTNHMCSGCAEYFNTDETVDIPYVGRPTFTMLTYCKPCARVVKALAAFRKIQNLISVLDETQYHPTRYDDDGSVIDCDCGYVAAAPKMATPEWFYMTELCGCDCASWGA